MNDENAFMLADTCRFLRAFQATGHVAYEELDHRIREYLRNFVPEDVDKMKQAVDALINIAMRFATHHAGERMTQAAFLRAAGIIGLPWYYKNIRTACAQLTGSWVQQEIVTGRDLSVAAPRHAATHAFHEFLRDPRAKLFVLVGQANIGKTRQIAEWARQTAQDTPTYVATARGFDWAQVGVHINEAMGNEGAFTFNTRGVIDRANETRPPDKDTAFLLYIDALDEVSPAALKESLRNVLVVVRTLPLKLIVSCKDKRWQDYAGLLASIADLAFQADDQSEAADRIYGTGMPHFSCALELLTPEERQEALQANNLPVDVPPAVIATSDLEFSPLFALLRLPAFLNIYYQVSRSNRSLITLDAVYAVPLFETFWRDILQKWTAEAGMDEWLLQYALQMMARTVRSEHQTNGELPLRLLRDQVAPEIMRWESRGQGTPLGEAVRLGILQRLPGEKPQDPPQIGFALPFLLEYLLMQDLKASLSKDVTLGDLSGWLQETVNEMWTHRFDPLYYALAFLLQDMCLQQHILAESMSMNLLGYTSWVDVNLLFFFVSDPVVPILARLLVTSEQGWKWQIARCLGVIRTRASVDQLGSFLGHPDVRVHEPAIMEFQRHPLVAVGDRTLIERLATLAEDSPDSSGWAPATSRLPDILRQIGCAELDRGSRLTLEVLESHLQNPDPTVRLRCALALAEIDHQSCVPTLWHTLETGASSSSFRAAILLGLAEMSEHTDAARLVMHLLALPLTDRGEQYWVILAYRYLILRRVSDAIDSAQDMLSRLEATGRTEIQFILDALADVEASGIAQEFLESRWQRSLPTPSLVSLIARLPGRRGLLLRLGILRDLYYSWQEGGTNLQATPLAEGSTGTSLDSPLRRSLYQIVQSLEQAGTDEEIAGWLDLRHTEPQLYQQLEAIGYALMTELNSTCYPLSVCC